MISVRRVRAWAFLLSLLPLSALRAAPVDGGRAPLPAPAFELTLTVAFHGAVPSCG